MKFVIFKSQDRAFKPAGTVRLIGNKVAMDLPNGLKDEYKSIRYMGKTFTTGDGIKYLKALTAKHFNSSYISLEFEPEDVSWVPQENIDSTDIKQQAELVASWRKELINNA